MKELAVCQVKKFRRMETQAPLRAQSEREAGTGTAKVAERTSEGESPRGLVPKEEYLQPVWEHITLSKRRTMDPVFWVVRKRPSTGSTFSPEPSSLQEPESFETSTLNK